MRCVLGPDVPPGVSQLAGLPALPLDGAAADAGADEATAEAPCLTFTTSGTTSGPKLVLHDQQTIAGHALDVARRIGLDAAEAVLLAAVPFCGTFGNAAAMAAIAGGAHIVCLAQFDGEVAATLIRKRRVTHIVGGDDMFGRIAAASGGRRFESVRFSGFAAFHSTVAASIAAAEAAGMHPHGLYGSSEVQALFSVAVGENRLWPSACRHQRRPRRCAIRKPAPRCRPARPANCGSTHRRVSSGIWKCSGDGTGDRRRRYVPHRRSARLGDAHFVFEARIDDAMRLGGFLVSPEEIEAVIQAEPGVASVQVVAAANGGSDPVPVRVCPSRRRRGAGRVGPEGALPPPAGAVQGPHAHRGGRGIPHRRQSERPEDLESPPA